MSTPEVKLDPRTYQDLVDEARTRAGRCDPGTAAYGVFDFRSSSAMPRLERSGFSSPA